MLCKIWIKNRLLRYVSSNSKWSNFIHKFIFFSQFQYFTYFLCSVMNKIRVYDISKWLHSVFTYVLHNTPVLFRIEVVIVWIVKPWFLGGRAKRWCKKSSHVLLLYKTVLINVLATLLKLPSSHDATLITIWSCCCRPFDESKSNFYPAPSCVLVSFLWVNIRVFSC